MARKKKRSAKQLANDRRLGRMAKARAKAKRGGRSRVTRKKVAKRKTRKNPHRKIRAPSAKRRIRAPVAKLTRETRWNIFKCYGKSVRWLGITTAGKIHWTIRDAAVAWTEKGKAVKLASRIAKQRGMSKYHLGVAGSKTTATQVATFCKGGKA